jgi:hypothetical protein
MCVTVFVLFLLFIESTLFYALVADLRNHLHVHPVFLHSNATSHKWIFGGMWIYMFHLINYTVHIEL